MSVTHKVPETSAAGLSEATGRRLDYPVSASIVTGLWILSDILCVVLAGFGTFHALVEWRAHILGYYASAICFLALASFLIAHYAGLYRFSAIIKPLDYLDKVIVVFVTGFLLLLALAFSLKVSEIFSRVWMYAFAISACFTTVGVRFLGSYVLHSLAVHGVAVRNVAIFGGGEQGKRLLRHISQSALSFVSVVGIFDDRGERTGPLVEGYPVLGGVNELITFCRLHRVDDVVIALPWSAEDRIASVMTRLRELPVSIHLGSDLAGYSLKYRQAPSHFERAPLVEIIDAPLSGWNIVWKSLEDKILACLILVAFAPVMAAVAIAIKMESPGPALFRQRRYGFNNKAFNIYKFRSMRQHTATGGVTIQATQGDARITRVGRFIRRTSLDELPQLFNVLNGTMSLVGPRPHAVDHNEEYSRKIGGYFARHRVKPGMTGWAQVNGWRGETDTLDKMEARVRHDITYAENWSLFFDLKILALTALVIVTGRNAR